MGAWKLTGVCALAVSLAMLGLTLGTGASPPLPSRVPVTLALTAAPGEKPVLLGAGSCAAQSCHGGLNPMAIVRGVNEAALRTEYTIWAARDKHKQAYEVLWNDRSKSIIRNLKPTKTYEDALSHFGCLACHVSPAVSAPPAGEMAALLHDGVSCEACHGPAGGWITKHTEEGWHDKLPPEKAYYGMISTLDLVERVQACVGCHVGAPADPKRGFAARDVNHDLIAAGHPRLNFEFGAYLANMPRHWRRSQDRNDPRKPNYDPSFEARAWLIGQVATTKAALDLLHSRADQAAAGNPKTPWPEFTEYGCFSCHFDLKKDSWRSRDRTIKDPEFGKPAWASWYIPMLRDLAQTEANGGAIVDHLEQVRKSMASPVPDAKAVAGQAKAASDALDGWLKAAAAKNLGQDRLRDLIGKFDLSPKPGETKGLQGWDHATQRYLALVALHQALAAESKQATLAPETKSKLEALLEALEYPANYDSPKNYPDAPAR